jgi:ribonucleoside-diphosphate reductase beta chain
MVRAIYNDVDVFIESIIDDEHIQKRASSILSAFDWATSVFDRMDANATASDNNMTKIFPEVDEKMIKTAIYKAAIVLNMFEGIRFFATFVTAWSFSEQPGKLMAGSSNIFKLIARDEMVHLDVFQKVIKMLRTDHSEGFVEIASDMEQEMYELYESAYTEELEWIDHLFSKGSPLIGMNADILKDYMDYIFAVRMTNIGLDPKKLGLTLGTNPLPWIDNYLDSSHIKSAPQEIESVNYVAAINTSLDEDFDLDDL